MNRSFQSGLSLLLICALVVAALLLLLQVDQLQSDSVATRITLAAIGERVIRIEEAVVEVEEDGPCFSSQVRADLADPANLLEPWVCPYEPRAASGECLPPTDPDRKSRVLRRALTSDPPSLDYNAGQNTSDVNEIYRFVGSKVGFQAIDDPGRFYPDLATKVTRAEDGLSYDVWLRRGVAWSPPALNLDNARYAWLGDRHDVVADDFLFTLELLQNPKINGRASAMRPYVAEWRIEVVDATHFRLKVPRAEHTDLPMLLDFWPTPRWLYGHDEDGRPYDPSEQAAASASHWYAQKTIGSGPYRLVEWQPGVRMVLEKNPEWHLEGCSPQQFSRIEMPVLKDPSSWLRYLKLREIDYTHVLPAQFAAEVRGKEPYLGEPHLKYAEHEDNAWFFIGYNQQLPLFADKRVRTAMTLSLDRKTLLDKAFAGLGVELSGPFDRNNPCYDPAIPPLPHDPARAAALLEEAGWVDRDGDGIREDAAGHPAAFTLLVPGGSTEWDTLARTWKEALQTLGVQLDYQGLAFGDLVQRLHSKKFDAGVSSWVPMWEVDLRQIWHSKEADQEDTSNFVSFKNAEGDRLAEAMAVEMDEQARIGICRQFHALFAEEQPYSILFQRRRAVLYWDDIHMPVFSKVNPQRDLRFFAFRPGD